MDLAPRHRLPIQLPNPWPSSARASIHLGGMPWLCDASTGESLWALPGSALTSTWDGHQWVTRLGAEGVPKGPWDALEAAVEGAAHPWVGAASFELACDQAGLPRKPLRPGTLGQQWIAVAEALHIEEGRAELWSWGAAPPDAEAWLARLGDHTCAGPTRVHLTSDWEEAEHRRAVELIQSRILDGAFYVANLCVPHHGHIVGDTTSLVLSALERARPPFGACLDLNGLQLLSLSMERLLGRRGDRLWSQPIKGSAPLTGNRERDQLSAEALAADPKERAEHTMILDLVRNDLGRVARPGSVRVVRPLSVEAYPTVQHLVSTVEATALPGLGLADLLRAVLPGGSVTGAPKFAVCAHLAEAEAEPRGFYCGALGWIAPTGDLDLALPIRTAQIQGQDITYWTGGGITRRSDPAREWAELHLKTRAILG